jgi:hypothetical protein
MPEAFPLYIYTGGAFLAGCAITALVGVIVDKSCDSHAYHRGYNAGRLAARIEQAGQVKSMAMKVQP